MRDLTFCKRIEIDFDNEKILKSFYPFYSVCAEETGIKFIECESIHECVRRARFNRPAEYKYMGTRYIYRVENEKKFLLLLIQTGLKYKELNPYSYSMCDEGND
jgi:hypothetical protein